MRRLHRGPLAALLLILFVWTAPIPSWADDDSATLAQPSDASEAIDAPGVSEPTLDVSTPQTVAQALDDDDSAAGISEEVSALPIGVLLAALSGVVALLVTLLRVPAVDAWLAAKGWKPYKPWLAALLGGIGAALAVALAGQLDVTALINAFVAGVVSGLGATGLHQIKTGAKG